MTAPRVWSARARPDFSGGNEVGVLRGGDQLFPAMLQAIAAARHEVWVASYIFHEDVAGAALVAGMRAAAQRGVRVRLVVDGFGSKDSLAWLQGALADSGVALAVFRPIDRWWRWLQPGQLRRLHQKLCVVDGLTGFVGGVNVIDDRIDLNHGPTDMPRLDFALSLRGPVVHPVEQAVRAVWTRAWLGRDFREELVSLFKGPAPLRRLKGLLQHLRLPHGSHVERHAQTQRPVQAAFVVRDNLRQRRTIERAYVEAIHTAQHSVDLITPYFYPGHQFRRALRLAAVRGVRVRLLLQGKVDYRIAAMAARALYDEMLGHGVKIYEYTPAYLHAKIAVIDGQWATVGSSNIDPLSLLLNLEANVIVRDEPVAQALSQEFEAAVAVSREVLSPAGQGMRAMLRRALVAWAAYVYLRVAGRTGPY